ncbi:MAG: GH3 auxin-responsive promoter family protein, partial [Bacteroidetes bacterium]|nr:GH3 auxin-responsive promoter family protein [Bacteroidota bacterium]
YASGGVAFETYRKDFEAVSGKPLVIMDTYLASEGFFSYTDRPGVMDMKLALEHGYFYEFIPFDERGVDERGHLLENPVSFSIDEVETDQDYVLVISTCAGAWRYVIGDTIKFTSLDPNEILITGRTKFFLNVVGSQLSEEKLDAAILEVSENLHVTVNEYSVAAVKNDDNQYIHQWVIVVNGEKIDEKEFEKRLDQSLKNANKNYGVARSKALKDIKVKAIQKEDYYGYLEQNKKKGGQVKTPKVMKSEDMNKLLAYIQD